MGPVGGAGSLPGRDRGRRTNSYESRSARGLDRRVGLRPFDAGRPPAPYISVGPSCHQSPSNLWQPGVSTVKGGPLTGSPRGPPARRAMPRSVVLMVWDRTEPRSATSSPPGVPGFTAGGRAGLKVLPLWGRGPPGSGGVCRREGRSRLLAGVQRPVLHPAWSAGDAPAGRYRRGCPGTPISPCPAAPTTPETRAPPCSTWSAPPNGTRGGRQQGPARRPGPAARCGPGSCGNMPGGDERRAGS